MHYVYLIRSERSKGNKELYVGCTDDIKRRIDEHNAGRSAYTSGSGKWKLIYCEVFRSKEDAVKREKALKNFGAAYGHLKRRLRESLQ